MPSDDRAGLKDHSDNDDNNNNIDVSDNDLPKTPNCTQDTTWGTKHKASMMDQIAEVTKSKCQNHFKIATINTDAKTLHAIEKEKIKCCAVLELEVTHLQHNAQEAAANHAHEWIGRLHWRLLRLVTTELLHHMHLSVWIWTCIKYLHYPSCLESFTYHSL